MVELSFMHGCVRAQGLGFRVVGLEFLNSKTLNPCSAFFCSRVLKPKILCLGDAAIPQSAFYSPVMHEHLLDKQQVPGLLILYSSGI